MNKRVRNKQQQQNREATGSLDGVISLIDSHNPQIQQAGEEMRGTGEEGGLSVRRRDILREK